MDPTQRLKLGEYPTPVLAIEALSSPHSQLWVKRDDLTHPGYGGNKVRKLERLLATARAAGATRLATVGAVGSHHVLATAYFGAQTGFAVEAVLFPQPRTPHSVEVVRAGLGLGLHAFAVSSPALAALFLGQRWLQGSWIVPPGGASVDGAMGYVDAARELAVQVQRGLLPEPDVCVVALGSGGTAAGLAAGFAAERMKTRVVGVCVLSPTWAAAWAARAIERACARRMGLSLDRTRRHARLSIDTRFLGQGYGYGTADGEAASRLAATHAELELDPTYTAKAFAAALWHVRARRAACVLYWHTLSSAPMRPLLERAPNAEALPVAIGRLLSPG